ncbi:hypothetical protein ACWDLG_02455 [Nonomuraea sp. NPDC003727]
MNLEIFNEVSVLWAQHVGRPYPSMGEVFPDFVLAESSMAGIVTS